MSMLRIVALVAISTLISGCSYYQIQNQPVDATEKVAFTQQMREQYKLSTEELQNLQYYISSDLTLTREITSGDREVTKGKLITKTGLLTDEVIVPSYTPGIATNVQPDSLFVSFEAGSALKFSTDSMGVYQVSSRGKALSSTVIFDGKSYQALEGANSAYLLIDKDAISETINKRRVLTGRKLVTQ